MLVQDTAAFIEQLEVLERNRRADRHRRRVARAELELLEVQLEVRLASEAVQAMEHELGLLHEPGLSPGRRPLVGRRERSLGREIEKMRGRVRAKSHELAVKRERMRALAEQARELDVPRPGPRMFRLHFEQHHLECSERRFARLATTQVKLPVLVTKREGRSWWWYLDRFWWDDEGLSPHDVEAIVLDADLRRRQEAAALVQARAAVLGESDAADAPEPLSQVVRFRVWCRDRGRCVDCGTAQDVRFDEIVPLPAGGSSAATYVELRCEHCRTRRTHNEVRARVSRAQLEAVAYAR